jgi:GNAT superfamily N-acetyltransferase
MAEPPLVWRPMTDAEYATWHRKNLEDYAREQATARGSTPEAALESAETQFAALLPDGAATEGVRLGVVETPEGRRVGILWVGPNPNGSGPAWVYDIEIEPALRGKGYGRAAMLVAERLASEDGYDAIALNVFGPNAVARALYASLGYEVTSLQMRKSI